MISRFPPRKVAVRWLGLGLGAGWAIFVVARYVGVDNGFAVTLIHKISLNDLLKDVLGSLLLVAVGAIVGYAAGQTPRTRLLVGLIGIASVGLVAWMLWPDLQAVWLRPNTLTDGTLATWFIAGAAMLGVGVSLGLRVGRYVAPPWFYGLCIGFPLFFVSLLAGAMTSLLALVWLFILAEAIGTIVLRWLDHLGGAPGTSIEQAGLLSIALGLAIFSLSTFGLGLAGGTSATGLILALLLATIFCLPQIRSSLTRLAALPWRRPVALSAFEIAAIFMLAALFCIFWIGALAPETGPDALGFRVAAPVIWLREGRIQPLPEMLGAYEFFTGEMIYLLMLPMTGFMAAKIVQVGLGVALVASAYAQVVGGRQRNDAALWLFAFWGSTVVWWQMFAGFVDVFQLFFYYASVLALRLWLDEPDRPVWLITAGVMGAAATTVKLNGAGALIVVGVVVAGVTLHRSRSVAKMIQNSLYWGVPAAVGCLPWLLWSYVLTQNPIFPFANSIFRSSLVPLDLPVAHQGVGLKFPEILTVPWGIFFDPLRFVELGTYHPLILAGVVLGGIGLARAARKDWLWLVAGAAAFMAWLVTEQNTRYSLYAVYLLWLALGIGLSNLYHSLNHRFLRGLFQCTLLAGLVWGFGMQAWRPSFWLGGGISFPALPTRVVLGSQSSSAYLAGTVATYNCAEWLNRHYGTNAKVWQVPGIRDHLYFDALVFSLPHGIQPQVQLLNEIVTSPQLIGDNAAIYRSLIAAGFTHVLYDPDLSSWMPANEADRQGVLSLDFERAYLQLECADRGLRLYKIRPVPLAQSALAVAGPELLSNVGFEVVNSSGQPANWNVNGRGLAIKLAGNMVLRLEDGATAGEVAVVSENRLYELTGDFRASAPAATGYFQLNFQDASSHLRLIWHEALAPTPDSVAYRFFQTAPAGAQTVGIFVSGSGIEVDNISLREIQP